MLQKFPEKQGLKLLCLTSLITLLFLLQKFPEKQGLKLFIFQLLNSSFNLLQKFPEKQGLKLNLPFPPIFADSVAKISRKARIETVIGVNSTTKDGKVAKISRKARIET